MDFCWRLLIGLGAVPGGIALYFRLTLYVLLALIRVASGCSHSAFSPETPRFTMDVERNVKQAATDVDAFLSTGGYVHDYEQQNVKVDAPLATRRDFFAHFGKWENGKVLLGTAYSWFALDVRNFEPGLRRETSADSFAPRSRSTDSVSPPLLYCAPIGTDSCASRFELVDHPHR